MASGGGELLESVKTLAENSKDVFMQTSEVILRIIRNIMKDPKNDKFRRLRVGTSVFTEKLLSVDGAMACLLELGFQEDGEFFSMPECVPASLLHLMKDQLESQQRISSDPSSRPRLVPSTVPSPHTVLRTPPRGASQLISPASNDKLMNHPSMNHPLLKMQMAFFKRLESGMQTVLAYEDSALQTQARSKIPMERLRKQASTRWGIISSSEDAEQTVGLQDLVLLELLAWFKSDFFKWVDAPECDRCKAATVNIGMAEPTPDELMWGAGHVEKYRCERCNAFTRFPRYNHPGMLLETRRGRCGEWANCFTLCCRAAGYETRYVHDWTDHVWTEVFSEHQQRWLHCDPCENVCDKPLLYEAGWGKKLTYVIAFNKDDVQDVTWRYSDNHEEVLARRREVTESWLLLTITRMRTRFWVSLPDVRKEQLKQRLVVEIVEFMKVKGMRTAGSEGLGGRSSGSLAWRSVRGETGAVELTKRQPVIIKLTEQEKAEEMIRLKYNSAIDVYVRGKDGDQVRSGWNKMVHETENIQRKVEHDWNMSYLARAEGADTATISWKFDFTSSGLVVGEVDVTAEDSRFETGQVVWTVCSEQQCAFLPPGGVRTVLADFAGSRILTVMAHLKGGVGNCAWQHTQLFRQKADEHKHYPLDILIKLMKEEA